MLNAIKILIKKILNLNLATTLEFENIKTFLLKDTHQIGQMEFLLLVKLKTQFLGITGNLCKKELKKTNQKEFRIKEILKEKVINCTSNGKGMIIVLIV